MPRVDRRPGCHNENVDPDRLIVAFDPGRNVGLARVDGRGELIGQEVLELEEAARTHVPWEATVLVGDGTGSAALLDLLHARGLTPELVDERGTTLHARRLYWRRNPPRGILRLLPEGLRPQPAQLDGYAAWALARRWLGLGDE